jgi:glyoxylase-like metal-dependent hydrolase (beta-lactamase superfamily II)
MSAMAKGGALPDPDTGAGDVYQIFQLRYAQNRARTVHDNFVIRDMHDGTMPLDYHLWILRNAHRTILVDTGFAERHAIERDRKLDIDPLEALKRLGIDLDAVEHVIVTHLHYDHAGNIGRLPKACFHVQDAEVGYATGRCMCDHLLRWPFDVEDVVALVRSTYAGRVSFHDGEGAPFPGITLHCLPGHSKGMQAVKVKTRRGPVLLASDTSHYYANFLRRAPFILTIDAAQTLDSHSRMLELVDGDVQRVIPGHDPKVRRLYPNHTFGGIELTALHEQPKPHTIEEMQRVDDF